MLYVQLSHGSFEFCTTERYQLFISMHNSQYIPALHWGGLTISPSLFLIAPSKTSFSVSFTYSFFPPFPQILANSLAFHPLSGSVFLSVLSRVTLQPLPLFCFSYGLIFTSYLVISLSLHTSRSTSSLFRWQHRESIVDFLVGLVKMSALPLSKICWIHLGCFVVVLTVVALQGFIKVHSHPHP